VEGELLIGGSGLGRIGGIEDRGWPWLHSAFGATSFHDSVWNGRTILSFSFSANLAIPGRDVLDISHSLT
jgi:hypothetical protein